MILTTLFTGTTIAILCLLTITISLYPYGAYGYSITAEKSVVPPQFSLTPAHRLQEGASNVAALRNNAASETFLDTLLGTNCYSKALTELQRDCRHLEQEEKSRLAVRLANCQLATQGQETYPCSSSDPLRECVERLSDKANFLYIEFLTHIDSMCLFIQNRNFEKYAETMLNRLSSSADFARKELETVGRATRDLAKDTSTIRLAAKETLDRLQEAHELHMAAAQEAKKHHSDSQHQFEELSMQQKLALDLVQKMTQASSKTAEMLLSMQHTVLAAQSGTVDALARIKSHTDELVSAHKTAAEGQRRLAHQVLTLLDDSQGLRTAMERLHHYQKRSNAALIVLLGNSYTFQDIVFYASSILLVLIFGYIRPLQYIHLPLMIILASVWLLERFSYGILHPWLEVDPEGRLTARFTWSPTWYGLLPWSFTSQSPSTQCTPPVCPEHSRPPFVDVSFDIKSTVRQAALLAAVSLTLFTTVYPIIMSGYSRGRYANPTRKTSNQRCDRSSTDGDNSCQQQLPDVNITTGLPLSTHEEPGQIIVHPSQHKEFETLVEVRTPRSRSRQRQRQRQRQSSRVLTANEPASAVGGDECHRRRSGRSRSTRR